MRSHRQATSSPSTTNRLLLPWILACLALPATTSAQLVADPGTRAAARQTESESFSIDLSDGQGWQLSETDAEGFSTLRFSAAPAGASSPGADTRWMIIRPTTGHWDWQAFQTLRLHVQNIMPWAITLKLQLRDADGQVLNATIGLPPGPPMRLSLPLTPTLPLAMGMRAAPPIPWSAEGERLGLAATTEGALNRARVTEIRLGMPTPDAEQKIRLGKIFLPPPEQNDVRAAYTAIVDAWGQYTRSHWPGKYVEAAPPKADETSKARQANRKKKAKEDPMAPFQPFARHVEQAEKSLNQALKQQLPKDPIAFDTYGGLKGVSTKAAADQHVAPQEQGYFRTGKLRLKDGSLRHVLITPEGNPFLSLGVNAVQRDNSETFIDGREYQFSGLPAKDSPLARFHGTQDSTVHLPADSGAQRNRGFLKGDTYNFYQANLFRRDGEAWQTRWVSRTQARLKRWGFNTVGAWSDDSLHDTKLPHTRIVHVDGPFARLSDGQNWWAGMPDPFDPAFGKALDATLAKATKHTQDDAALIGWFVDNELGWGDGASTDPAIRYALAWSALQADGSDAQAHAKRALVQMLRERYDGDIQELSNVWGVPLSSWADLDGPWPAERRPDAQQPAVAADLSAFLRLHADSYFSQVAKALKKHAPNHLYLGSRFSSRTPEAVSACARWCDVLSFNLYVPNLNDGFEHAQFARHDKPALLTEFHFGSTDRGPFWPGVMQVETEADRGPAYRHMLDSVLANPQFVGAHWFQYLDQPVTGRWLDGENGHLGLVAITDIPWHDFVLSVQRSNLATLQQLKQQAVSLEATTAKGKTATPEN
ncbi:MAG: beta-galactosidase [Lautropia sp.]|nr:beta-galactosidase [Lautropia sp.]